MSPQASEEANLVSVTTGHFFPLEAPNSVECDGPMALIGSARLRRRHFKSRSLVNSYRAGAHCDLVTHDGSALFSAPLHRS